MLINPSLRGREAAVAIQNRTIVRAKTVGVSLHRHAATVLEARRSVSRLLRCARNDGALKPTGKICILGPLMSMLLLTACATQQQTVDPNSPEYASAIQSVAACFLQQATLVDDHKSDAQTIAQAIQGTCTSEWNNVVALQIQGRAPYEQTLMLQDIQANGEENSMAINAVLTERKQSYSN